MQYDSFQYEGVTRVVGWIVSPGKSERRTYRRTLSLTR